MQVITNCDGHKREIKAGGTWISNSWDSACNHPISYADYSLSTIPKVKYRPIKSEEMTNTAYLPMHLDTHTGT